MTASTPDELIAGFPMNVASYVGGGRHGRLGIIMTNEEYFAIASNVFPVPENPGASDEVVVGMTAAVIA
jgi:hypothetical protein